MCIGEVGRWRLTSNPFKMNVCVLGRGRVICFSSLTNVDAVLFSYIIDFRALSLHVRRGNPTQVTKHFQLEKFHERLSRPVQEDFMLTSYK